MNGFDFPAHIATKVEQAHTKIDDLTGRVNVLEKDSAVRDERMIGIQASLTEIKTSIGKVAWLIVTAIIGGIMTFILKGGLSG
ncbi:hemolysin XhlA family protein [Rhizobium pusense]|uniref:hemolysin XhlA family protein n=1 Tax=Agrobacterium pusense TaxID=648995 RepID=UPI00244AF301|nr:hemolysin XhlA family protein [Agrobacterium pusense]MDH1093823.1 hemolysin XhlA family protein [Agrobacterium pusense]MDH1110281.1 hemolysin XhlA family protein [Agrobacterium pusense]MDH2193723.1 hemolysin XhlA family protein [Agrobacterium pusense]